MTRQVQRPAQHHQPATRLPPPAEDADRFAAHARDNGVPVPAITGHGERVCSGGQAGDNRFLSAARAWAV